MLYSRNSGRRKSKKMKASQQVFVHRNLTSKHGKIREKYDAGDFDPFSFSDGPTAYQHRLWYGIFVVGRYWLLRGTKEVANLLCSQVKFCTATENGVPVSYIEIVHHYDRSMKLDLKNTTARSTKQLPPRLYPNTNDALCPVKNLTFFHSIQHETNEAVGSLQKSADATTITNEVTANNGDSTLNTVIDDMTLQMMVPYAGTCEGNESTEVMTKSETMNTNIYQPYNINNLPLVTPHEVYRSIVTQHHLNNIKKKEEKLWKEKYNKAKQEACDAKFHHNHNNRENTTFVCSIKKNLPYCSSNKNYLVIKLAESIHFSLRENL
jgi:hypothetical protein